MIEVVWEIVSCWCVNNSHLLMRVKTKELGSFEMSVTTQVCSVTFGHYWRRWFPRSLWSKKLV